jgi:hypothetical protein
VLGGSHLSMASDGEVEQWQEALTNTSGVTIVVQTRSNLLQVGVELHLDGLVAPLPVLAAPAPA